MGVVLPLLPKRIELPSLDGNFSNTISQWGRTAGSGSSALYREASANYNKALNKHTELIEKRDKLGTKLSELKNYFEPYEELINSERKKMGTGWNSCDYDDRGVLNPVFNLVVRDEFYGKRDTQAMPEKSVDQLASEGYGKFHKWIPNRWMRRAGLCIERLTEDNWEYIYRWGGGTADPHYRTAMLEIVKDWSDKLSEVRKVWSADYVTYNNDVNTAQENVNKAKEELDKALEAEKLASNQRIAEAMTDPDYVQAQSQAQQAILAAQTKQKTRTMLFAVIGLTVLVGGAALIFKNR